MSDMLARLMALIAMQSGGADLSDYYTKAETDRHISDEVAKIVSDAPEDFDTLRELSDWIATHEESAAAMNSAIQANTAGVAALYAEVATKAPQSTTYTKTEVDTALDSKADTTDIPTVPITAIQKNGTDITPVSGTVNIIVPTTAKDISALPDTTKYAAAISLTINSSTFVMTGQLKDQNGDNLGTAQTIDLPLESVVVGGSYNSQTKKVVLTLQNGNTIEFSVADLVSGLQTELSASNKLNPAYINYDSTHRAVSDTEKSTWNNKQDSLTTAQLAAVNSGITAERLETIDTALRDKQVSLFDTTAFSSLSAHLDTLNNGTHSFLIPNNNSLTDVPTEINNSNTIATVRIYNTNSAVVEAVPISTTYQQYRYTRIKSAGLWRQWYKFEGTAVT